MNAHSSIEAGSESRGVETQTRLDTVTVSTPIESPSYVSTFQTPEQYLDDLNSRYFMAEEAGGHPPSVPAHDAPTAPESEIEDPEFTMTSAQLDLDDHSFTPSMIDHDQSSLFPLSSENGDHERANNQTLIEEHEMRRKLMDIESSFLPEPSTIDVAMKGPVAGADDTYLVGIPKDHDISQNDPSQLSFSEPTEAHHTRDQENFENHEEKIEDEAAPTGPTRPEQEQEQAQEREQEQHGDSMFDSRASSPSAAAALRRNQSTLSENAQDNSQYSQEERPFRSEFSMVGNESQLTPSKLRNTDRSLSPGASRLLSDQSGSAASSRRASRPKYLTSRQSAHRLSHSSVASNNTNNTETTNSDATLGADYALQTGGAIPENWSSLNTPSRAHMTRTTSLGSMASGVSGYSEENSVEKRNTGPIDGGLHTLEEESSPQSRAGSRQQPNYDDVSAPVTPKAKPQDSNPPTDTVIADRVKGIQIPTTFAQRFREDFQPSPEKRTGASTPAFGKSGRTLTLKEQSSTIDRLSKDNFDLKMRVHFLNEALNRRSEEGIKEMIGENVELKSDKVKLQKDNQSLKRKIRDLEKQVKEQQSDKESMVNHDPEGSEDGDRDSAQDGEIVFLRERVETYELEIERMRSESIAREGEKRRLAEMVKSLSENRAGESDAGAREERVSHALTIDIF
jgi:hypothetical protein